MSEMDTGTDQSSSNFAPAPPVTPSSTPSTAPTDERTFRQSEVNDLVGRAKNEAVERYKRESSMASHNQTINPQWQSQQPSQSQTPSVSQDDVRRLAAEEIQRSREGWIQESNRAAQEQDAHRIAQEFFTKVGAGEGGMQSFEKKIADAGLDLRSIPYHVQLANMMENTREVMIELADNPTKIGAIQNLIDLDLKSGRQPNLAMAEMKRLSQSLKENAGAKSYRSPNEPLSQVRPSSTAGTDTGARTAGDYRRNPAYRV